MRGHCFMVRFADDFVIGFQHEEDARRVVEVLPKRFEKYGLEIHPEKSRLLSFGKPASDKAVRRGDNTFDFLGFTHYWARSRQGYWVIKQKTASKKVKKTVQALWERGEEEPAYGSGETAQDIERQTSRTLPVLWRTLQHARDGGGTVPG